MEYFSDHLTIDIIILGERFAEPCARILYNEKRK